MKEIYKKPDLDFLMFDNIDIITTSEAGDGIDNDENLELDDEG